MHIFLRKSRYDDTFILSRIRNSKLTVRCSRFNKCSNSTVFKYFNDQCPNYIWMKLQKELRKILFKLEEVFLKLFIFSYANTKIITYLLIETIFWKICMLSNFCLLYNEKVLLTTNQVLSIVSRLSVKNNSDKVHFEQISIHH